jgi:hypothetical protein
MTVQDGISQGQGDGSPAIFFEGDKLVSNRGANIEGDVTGTGVTANSLKIKGDQDITNIWRTTYTWNMGAIAGVVGSTNAVISVDAAMSGVALADTVIAHPVGSLDDNLHWASSVHSANNVHIKAWYTGSVGALTPGNVPFKITAIKL